MLYTVFGQCGGKNTWEFETDHGILGLSCIFMYMYSIRIDLWDKIAMQFIFSLSIADLRLYLSGNAIFENTV